MRLLSSHDEHITVGSRWTVFVPGKRKWIFLCKGIDLVVVNQEGSRRRFLLVREPNTWTHRPLSGHDSATLQTLPCERAFHTAKPLSHISDHGTLAAHLLPHLLDTSSIEPSDPCATMATIKALSTEIVIEILKAIPDLNSLHEAVHAAPLFYRVYTASAAEIYSAITMQHLRDFPTNAYYYNPNGWFQIHLTAEEQLRCYPGLQNVSEAQRKDLRINNCIQTLNYVVNGVYYLGTTFLLFGLL